MKINIERIRPRSDDDAEHMNVTVLISDDGDLPLRNVQVNVYVDKKISDLKMIEDEAIEQALDFLSEIVSIPRPRISRSI